MQIPMQIIKIKVRKLHFQLLELMVATFILLVCITPAMHIFTSLYKSEQLIVRENYRDHIARIAHAAIIEQLYKRQISIVKKVRQTIQIQNNDLNDLLKKYAYTVQGDLLINQTSNKDGHRKFLGELTIKVMDDSQKEKKTNTALYKYNVYIDSTNVTNDESNEKKRPGGEDDEDDPYNNINSLEKKAKGKKKETKQNRSDERDILNEMQKQLQPKEKPRGMPSL